jgi:hypothetical protein
MENTIFKRVESSYDLERMKCTRIIAVGCGGAASFLQDLARCGVGEFVLIDPDVVEEPNIATQQVFLEDIGRPKVDCLADRINQINPDAYVEAYQASLDEFDDVRFKRFIKLENYSNTLLCGLSDDFYCQARVNRLALSFGLPSLCAQLYQYGHAAEVSFTYPGVTSACHRCMLSPRYKAYLKEGYQNNVTSAGSSIFATQRLNAIKGFITLAMLHHGTNHPQWGEVLSRIGNCTLVQIRMHPHTGLKIFSRVFSDIEHCFFDESVWLPQEPEPNCPDCGGTGNLLAAKGTFADTREMR